VALATSQTQPNTTRSALVIADATVAITVDYSGAGAAQASSILATLRVRPIDRSGCPALLPTDLATPVAGMRERFVPGTPLSGAVCRYDQGDLAGSVPLSGENLSTVRDALNAMPVGRPLHPTCAMGTLVAYTVRMVYPGGAAITVSVSGVGCSGFATNGAAQSQDLGSLPALLERLATSPS
jgi:hypothetical protein